VLGGRLRGWPHTLQDDFARAVTLTQRCWPPRGRGRSAAVRRSQAIHSERASAAQKLQTIMRRLSGAIVRSGLAPKSSSRGVRANAPLPTHCSATAASAHARGVLPTEWRRQAMRAPSKYLGSRLRAWCATQTAKPKVRTPYIFLVRAGLRSPALWPTRQRL